MINLRQIFNPSYNYIGIIFIIFIALTIFIIQKNTVVSIYQISRSGLIAGIIILLITLLISFIMEFLIVSSYRIFIEVITKNVISSLYFYSITIIIISSIVNLMLKATTKVNE